MGDRSAGEEASALEHASACEWAAWRDIDVHVTSTRTDISPLACTAENSMDLSALSKSPARCRMLAQGRAPEDADVVSAKAWRSEAHVGLDIGRPRLGEANPVPPELR